MRKVHPAAWIGLVINGIVMIMGLMYFNEEAIYYYQMGEDLVIQPFELVISLVFIAGFALSLAGVVLLALGKPVGGVVGGVGSVIFVPIGMICLFGCMQSRTRMLEAPYLEPKSAVHTTSPGGVVSGQARPHASGNLSGAKSMAGSYSTPAKMDGSGSQSATLAKASSGSAPLDAYYFNDQSWCAWIILAFSGIGTVMIFSMSGTFQAGFTMPIVASILMLVSYRRVADLPVFAFHADSLEFTPSLYSSSLMISYGDIVGVEVKKNYARLQVRRPDGAMDKKQIGFGFIKGAKRNEARSVFSEKMQELGLIQG